MVAGWRRAAGTGRAERSPQRYVYRCHRYTRVPAGTGPVTGGGTGYPAHRVAGPGYRHRTGTGAQPRPVPLRVDRYRSPDRPRRRRPGHREVWRGGAVNRFLVTGVSGAGKTTLARQLHARRHHTVSADADAALCG
jgi:hypothetical protein